MKQTLFLTFAFVTISSFAQFNYPITKTVDSSNTYFGITYKDSYRWLENMKNPEVENWFRQQAKFTNNILENITGTTD